jgi:hypothetical protein
MLRNKFLLIIMFNVKVMWCDVGWEFRMSSDVLDFKFFMFKLLKKFKLKNQNLKIFIAKMRSNTHNQGFDNIYQFSYL